MKKEPPALKNVANEGLTPTPLALKATVSRERLLAHASPDPEDAEAFVRFIYTHRQEQAGTKP